ncbi:MAG: DUF1501 domain-containing protein [Planctomycetota bacterium]|nr:MAG: DUF1501 domain-containing protein [Planctomycetota bacterium]REJ92652.1 MAG: DUF1501 domain-containing protein [Planctomycetota bacterium]REK26779.1 MAG: DUF1501 domain-containing protein [Planctomycetota bacterium]REK35721.1 MAG: DUF1501 domain-containing protein [Planctomycetota bacterium]
MEVAAKSALGVSMLPALSRAVEAAPQGGRAKRLIYLYMGGGMTHLDTFDLKPGHENQGETEAISTSVPGVQISEFLPTVASQFKHIAAIRSMFTQTGDHAGGEYLMRTSYEEIATTRHPSMGPWIQKFKGRQNKSLPDTVLISAPARHPGPGFFDPTFSPLPIGDPNRGLENTDPPAYLTDSSFEKRVELIDAFDKNFREKFNVRKVRTYTDLYTEATSLLSSEELKAFDLNEVEDAERDRYGRDRFGQGCLLARRLIENNVRCVEVTFGGWDMHNSIYSPGALPARTGVLDRALGNLLKDLSESGLLSDTLIALTTEFGRSPVINYNAGRDHHPAVFSALLAGGGVQGGQLYGKSDEEGHGVEEDGVSPSDFNATIATALGLPLEEEVFSPTGRPFTVAHDGTCVEALL